MKNRNRLLIVTIGILASIACFAQKDAAPYIVYTPDESKIINNYPDTIRMSVEDIEITFAFDRISNKEEYFINTLWTSAISIMETAVGNSSIDEGKLVTYQKILRNEEEIAKVEVTPLKTKETYLIGLDGTEEYNIDRVEFHLIQEDLFVSFSLNDLRQIDLIKDLKIETLWQQIDQKYSNEGSNNIYGGQGKFSYGNAQLHELDVRPGRHDNIEITILGFGLGYYRDRFVPDLGSKIAFNIHDRLGNDWLEFGFLYTQQYFFSKDSESSNYDLDLNGWLTGYGKIDFAKMDIGVGIGSLIHRDGGFFQGSTWKLSMYADDDNSNFSFSPELIFTDDFKTVFPALRVGLSF